MTLNNMKRERVILSCRSDAEDDECHHDEEKGKFDVDLGKSKTNGLLLNGSFLLVRVCSSPLKLAQETDRVKENNDTMRTML